MLRQNRLTMWEQSRPHGVKMEDSAVHLDSWCVARSLSFRQNSSVSGKKKNQKKNFSIQRDKKHGIKSSA